MFSTVLSATLHGLSVEFIDVEADVSNGLPMFHLVGYLSSEVKEAGERVRTALRKLSSIFRRQISENREQHLICLSPYLF